MVRSLIKKMNGLIILSLYISLSTINKPIAAENKNDDNFGIHSESQYTQLCNMILKLVNITIKKDKITVDTLDQLDSTVICYDKIRENIGKKIIRILYKDNDSTFKFSTVENYLNSNFQYISYCMADGPDGTGQVYLKNRVMLLLDGKWDGGDDSDPTYVPSEDYEFTFYIMKTQMADSVLIPLINR